MTTYTFQDNLSKNLIVCKPDPPTLWIENYFIDEDNPKLFVALLQTTLRSYLDQGLTIFKQWVSDIDWNTFLHKIPFWRIVYLDPINQVRLIECDLIDAPKALIEAFLDSKED